FNALIHPVQIGELEPTINRIDA
ncbi:MAG: hypothetical protein RLZZ325_1143, partial [Pseudomonadota bacterium]